MSQYYPALNKLIQVDKIPEPLKQPITHIVNKLFYKGYFVEKSVHGDVAYYSITIVINSEVGLNLFGGEEGFELLFNPSTEANTTEIPLTLYYNLPILRYIKTISISDLSTPEDYFNLITKLLNISPDRLLLECVYQIYNGSFEDFVNAFNTNPDYSPIPQDFGGNDDEIAISISNFLLSNGVNIYQYIAEVVAIENDIEAGFQNLYNLFKELLGVFTFENILDLLIPKFSVSIQQLELALAFPRTWLQPVDANGEVNPDTEVKSMLRYNAGSISYHSEKGFEFNNVDRFDLDRSQIGNTGLILEIQNLKFDFRTDKNIPEATADGRPDSFKGVYVEYAAITLPSKWFNDDEVVGGVTAKVAGYNLLIGTGGLSGTIALETQTFRNSDGSIVNYYTDYFQFQYPIQTTHKDASNNLVITDINNHVELKTQLEDFDATQFIFPLSLVKNEDSEPTVYENVAEYYSYLNTLYNASDEANKPRLSKRIGSNGFEAWFTRFDMTFQQGSIVESNIQGGLKIPRLKDALGNDAEVLINGHLNEEGDFNLTASEPDGFQPINIPEVLNIYIQSVELGREDDKFYIGTSCDIEFTNPIIKKLFCGSPPRITIPRIRFYENGKWEIVGGGSFIPTNISLCLGPIEMSVTNMHKGSFQGEHNGISRQYEYWGFDGAISIDPLGVDARGEGIKYYYTVDNDEHGGSGDSFLRIQTIEVDLVIPGSASPASATAIIHGMVAIPEPGESPEYIGEVSLKLPKAKISGGAAMRLQPRHPAFLIDAFIDLPSPIPIGPLSIYGFRGLLGFRYVAEKEAVGLVSGEDTWYDYFTYPPKGIHVTKFSGPERTEGYNLPFSVGAGAVLGTGFDSGTIISIRAMLLLSLPTLFLVEGKASILSARLGLEDNREPPFFAFVAWGDNSIEMGMGADFQLPQKSGLIIDLYAEVQAGFFFNNPKAWYVNFGTRDLPITARLFKLGSSYLLTAQSYLMLSATGIEAGARVEFDLKKRFGPAKVHIYAYLEMGGFVSFERPQIGGYIALGGMIDIDIWIIGITIELDVLFAAEAAKPFLIYAEVKLRVCIKIIFARVCKGFTVKLKWEKNKEIDRTPIPPLPYKNGENHSDRTKELVQAVHMLTNDSFELNYLGINISGTPSASQITKIIPLDTYIDIKTVKGLIPGAVSQKIGGHTGGATNYTDLIPPQRVVRGGRELRQVKHKYSIEDIEIKAWTGSNWITYHPFEALVPSTERNKVNHLRIGYWQRTGNQYDAIRLLATNPLSYTEAGEPGWLIPEQYGITPSELFCEGTHRDYACSNVFNKGIGTVYYPPTQYIGHYINGAYFTLEGDYYTTVNVNEDGTQTISTNEDNFRVIENNPPVIHIDNKGGEHPYEKSLEFDKGKSLVIILPEPSVQVKLRIKAGMNGATIRYYKSNGVVNYNTQYSLLHEEFKASTELEEDTIFPNTLDTANLISKIVVEAHKDLVEEQGDCSYCGILESLENHFDNCFTLNANPSMNQLNGVLSCLEEFADIIGCRESKECGGNGYGYGYNYGNDVLIFDSKNDKDLDVFMIGDL